MENKYLSLTNKVFHVMNDEKHSDDDLIRNLTEWKKHTFILLESTWKN